MDTNSKSIHELAPSHHKFVDAMGVFLNDPTDRNCRIVCGHYKLVDTVIGMQDWLQIRSRMMHLVNTVTDGMYPVDSVTDIANMLIKCGLISAIEIDQSEDDEPHGSRDTFVPHPDGHDIPGWMQGQQMEMD